MRRSLAAAVVLCGILSATPPGAGQEIPFIRGDVNQDGGMDLADVIAVLFHLFSAPDKATCEKAADIDDSGAVDISDPVFALLFLFLDGRSPPPPFVSCGTDRTPDDLGCARTWCAEGSSLVMLAESCSSNPAVRLEWKVTNLKAEPVSLEWKVARSAQGGRIDLPALGTVVLATSRVSGVNELTLYHQGAPAARLAQARVSISEFMASNAESLNDEDGDSSDWLELHMDGSPCGLTIDLTGWFLTDDPADLRKWRFPEVSLKSGDYLVVFASGKDRAVAGSELHTGFLLAKEGGYLALVAADGATVLDEYVRYPEQLTDVSFGAAHLATALVQAGDEALYRVPSAADAGLGEGWADPAYTPAGWKKGATGLGFTAIATQGFEVTCIRANVPVCSFPDALAVLDDPAKQAQVVTEEAPFIDYFNSYGRGNYANDLAFPGLGFIDVENFVVHVTGTVTIPEAGEWSFGVSSDDGFVLELTSPGRYFSAAYPSPRGPADTIEVFQIPEAGPYEVDLVFYECGGGSELELFAARGNHPVFDYDSFRLVGDVAGGGLPLLGFASEIGTDVGGVMEGVNASLWARIDFQADDPAAFGELLLRMEYEDGFVAYLNGSEVARRYFSGPVRWNSSASSDRPIEDAPVPEEIDLTGRLGLLRSGRNVLAIHGLNDSASNGDFLIRPRLTAVASAEQVQYMPVPTPRAFNLSGGVDFVRGVEFSVDHGFFDAPFSLQLSTPTLGAEIRYTLDGSTPAPGTGTVYRGPLAIDGTTIVRAAAFKPNELDSPVRTRTYLFVQDVVRQSPLGEAPGPGWPTGSVNGQILDYGMDPDIVDGVRWAGLVEEALVAIPTLSLVTEIENLFSPATGIYVNAWNDGLSWERRTSVELIHPDGTKGFAIDAGLRIRGAFSRSGDNPKHSFRLIFRNKYGGKLQYHLFGGEGAGEFDKIDLRTSQNYSWAYDGGTQDSFIREVFSRDVQRDMGDPYTRSRYYHLYIDGQYWGLYQTQERADADFGATYLGGSSKDYDAIKNDSSGSRALQATDGTMDAYQRLYGAAVAGFSTDGAYFAVQGLRSNGMPDPDGEKLVNLRNLMDYMVCTYYTGDPDSPVSVWGNISNNLFAIYDRKKPDGFTWYRHDAEHSLGASGGLSEGRLLTDPEDRALGQEWWQFNPAWLHLRLTDHPEYGLRFADRVNRCFFNGGILTSARNIERWMARADQIQLAIVAESARWGDSKTNPPRTRDDWQALVDSMVNGYFPQRTQIVLDQMRSVGMFPGQAIVSFNRRGGEVAPGSGLRLWQENGARGTIYYTLDGSDPRLRGGGLNPAAAVFADDTSSATLIGRGSSWRYKDDGSDQGTAWRGLGFPDGGWKEGPAELGYGDDREGRPEATVVGFGPNQSAKFLTTYFRRRFQVADASEIIGLTLGIVRDDGAAVYLNGVEATPRINLPGGDINYLTRAQGPGVPVGGADESTFYTFTVDPGLLVDGSNVLAVEIHQESGGSSDISFDLELTALIAGGASPSISLDEAATVRARVRDGGGWGAMTEARFTVGLKGLVINEIMASNHATLEDPDEPGESPDWLEVFNGTSGAIDLGGMYLTDSLQELTKWRIAPGVSIGAGRSLVFYADDDGTQGVRHTSFNLNAGGESIALVDVDGETIIDSIVFDGQLEDVSFGRSPDGADRWGFLREATPGSANGPLRP